MSVAAPVESRVQGILCAVGGMMAISLQDMMIKWMSGSYPLHEIIIGRATIAIVLTIGFAHLEGGFGLLKTRRPLLHLARGLLLVAANMCYFLALAAMPLAEAAAIFFVAPLFITALSAFFLGERVGARRWIAVFVGMAGVVVMLRPGVGVFEVAALLPILGALCYASMTIVTRRLGVTDRASTQAFYVQCTFIAASGAMGFAVGDGHFAGGGHPSVEFLLRGWTWPSGFDALLILACGTLIGIGAYLMSQAYRVAEANVVAPFEYVALPMATLWGFLVWGDLPDLAVVTGIALIVGSGLFVFYRETVRGRLVASQRPMPRNR